MFAAVGEFEPTRMRDDGTGYPTGQDRPIVGVRVGVPGLLDGLRQVVAQVLAVAVSVDDPGIGPSVLVHVPMDLRVVHGERSLAGPRLMSGEQLREPHPGVERAKRRSLHMLLDQGGHLALGGTQLGCRRFGRDDGASHGVPRILVEGSTVRRHTRFHELGAFGGARRLGKGSLESRDRELLAGEMERDRFGAVRQGRDARWPNSVIQVLVG